MKLAEALQERADLKRNLNSLRERLQRVTLVQEGEKPAEDPQELLRIQDACFERMEYLIAAINHSNDVIQVNGMTLTQLIAKKDVLLMKLAAYKNVIRDAGSNTNRARGTEIRILSTVKAAGAALKNAVEIFNHYQRFPVSEKGFDEWREKADALYEKIGRIN